MSYERRPSRLENSRSLPKALTPIREGHVLGESAIENEETLYYEASFGFDDFMSEPIAGIVISAFRFQTGASRRR